MDEKYIRDLILKSIADKLEVKKRNGEFTVLFPLVDHFDELAFLTIGQDRKGNLYFSDNGHAFDAFEMYNLKLSKKEERALKTALNYNYQIEILQSELIVTMDENDDVLICILNLINGVKLVQEKAKKMLNTSNTIPRNDKHPSVGLSFNMLNGIFEPQSQESSEHLKISSESLRSNSDKNPHQFSPINIDELNSIRFVTTGVDDPTAKIEMSDVENQINKIDAPNVEKDFFGNLRKIPL